MNLPRLSCHWIFPYLPSTNLEQSGSILSEDMWQNGGSDVGKPGDFVHVPCLSYQYTCLFQTVAIHNHITKRILSKPIFRSLYSRNLNWCGNNKGYFGIKCICQLICKINFRIFAVIQSTTYFICECATRLLHTRLIR